MLNMQYAPFLRILSITNTYWSLCLCGQCFRILRKESWFEKKIDYYYDDLWTFGLHLKKF